MKQSFHHIILFMLIGGFIYTSGGATLYSHFCATKNESFTTFMKTHCETEQEEKEPSCHQKEEQEPCCTDTPSFETQDQLVYEFDQVVFLAIQPLEQPFVFNDVAYQKLKPTTAVNQLARPPNLRACIRFQQFLS